MLEFTKKLLVEGKDEVKFFEAYLNHLKINNIEIQSYNGKYNLDNFLKEIKHLGKLEDTNTLIIQMDYDEGENFKTIEKALENSKITIPNKPFEDIYCEKNTFKVAFFFTPPESLNNQKAELETLCLSILKKNNDENNINYHDVLNLATEYIHKVNNQYKTTHKLDKSILHAYFAAFCRSSGKADNHVDIDNLAKALGREIFDFGSPNDEYSPMQKYNDFFKSL